MFSFRGVIGALVICLVGKAAGVARNDTMNATAEIRHGDNKAESTVTSYSTVVIHRMADDVKEGTKDQDKEESRSESYFTMHNGKTRDLRPNMAPKNHKIDEHKLRFEGDFRPMTTPPVERPQRLINHHYNRDRESSEEEPRGRYRTESRRPIYKKFEKDEDYSTYSRHEDKYPEKTSFRSEWPARKPVDRPSKSYKKTQIKSKHPPPGMSEDLMESLLQQEPQTFGSGDKTKRYEPKKKYKSPGNPSTFNVGYSIGFGGVPSDDVVFGKPKDLKLHVNGEKSVWKTLHDGVEMSHELERKRPLQYRVPDPSPRTPKINILKSGGQSLFYTNNDSPDITSVPTSGRGSFDHNRALTTSNLFDFSNAMSGPPVALPLTSNLNPELQPYAMEPKGRGLDLMSLYQSMGYSAPIPVLIPSAKGAATMVHAIVIPLQNLPTVDWGLPGMFPTPVTFTTPPVQPYAANHRPEQLPLPSSYSQHRVPKLRQTKDTGKTSSISSFASKPIVVAPMNHRPVDLQKEQAALNAILAREMSRKKQRHPLGLRPPSK